MSLTIKYCALHQLNRKSETEIERIENDHLVEDHSTAIDLISNIHQHFNGKSRAFALFNEDSHFKQSLIDLREGPDAFLSFSKQSLQQLEREILNYPFVEGGTVVFCHYQYLAIDYLLIAVLKSCSSLLVNDKLEIRFSHYLDVDRADVIARVDLTQWQKDPDSKRYLTFLKGRVGRKVADFFLDYLGAAESINVKQQNKLLTEAVDEYCDVIQLDKPEKQAVREQLYDYCKGQLTVGEEIALDEIAQTLPQKEDYPFDAFIQDQHSDLEESFPVDRTVLRALKKYSGSGGGVTISFDSDQLGSKIIWDEEHDRLIINGLPPNLKDQLNRNR